MLVLSRKVGEKILIGDNISVTVVRVGQGMVRIGVEAPSESAGCSRGNKRSNAGPASEKDCRG